MDGEGLLEVRTCGRGERREDSSDDRILYEQKAVDI